MSEIWLDKQTGKLSIGRDATGEYADYRPDYELDFPDEESQLHSLADLIDAPERRFDFPTDDFVDYDRVWTRDDMLEAGRWVMTLLEKDGQPQPLRERHMRHLRSLGFGAAMCTIRREFKGFLAFKEELNSPFLHARGRFDHWSIADYVHFAQKLATRLGRKPEEPDYIAAFEADECPSLKAIYERTGGRGKLHELIGYPDIRGWENEDFVLWGVNALRANMETGIPPSVIDELSRRKRGPCTRSVVNRFDSVNDFQVQVENELERQDTEEAVQRNDKLAHYHQLIARGVLSRDLLKDEDRLLVVGAQRLVVDRLLPRLPPSTKYELSMKRSDRFMYWVLHENQAALRLEQGNPALNAGTVEAIAVQLGVFDDIWPLKQEREYLHVDLPRARHARYYFGRYRDKAEAKQAA